MTSHPDIPTIEEERARQRKLEEDWEAAMQFVLNPEDEWVRTLTIAHLRIPRMEFLQYTDMARPEEVYNIVAGLIVDKALAAFSITTWPGHDLPGGP